jgi:hypothetical protein
LYVCQSLTLLLQLHPTFAAAAYNRALAYSLAGDSISAEIGFENAMKLDEFSPNIPMYWAQTKITPVYTYIMERGGSAAIFSSLNSTQVASIYDATQLIDKVHTRTVFIVHCYRSIVAVYKKFLAQIEHRIMLYMCVCASMYSSQYIAYCIEHFE